MCSIRAIAFNSTPMIDTMATNASDQDFCPLIQKVVAIFGFVISASLAYLSSHPFFIFSALGFAVLTIGLFCQDACCSDDDAQPEASKAQNSAARINEVAITRTQS